MSHFSLSEMMRCCVFVLVVLWISGNYFSHSVSGSLISVHSNTTTVTEGDALNITCRLSANTTDVGNLTFLWRKLGAGTVVANSSQLTFANVSRTDSGNYSCNVTNGTAHWSDEVTITVFYPPQILSSTRNLTVNESFETSLFCNASGNPPPNIEWSLPNGSSIVLENNTHLLFENTSKGQHGRYSCKATNLVGNSSSIVMYLNVQYKPKINRTGLEVKIDSWLYHNSTLTCQAEGNPSPKITWSKDKKELPNGRMSGSIHVIPKDDNDFGNYTCTARNALGKDELHVSVVRTEPTTKPTVSKTTTSEPTIRATKASDSNSKYIYGAGAGGAVLLLVIIITVVCCAKRRRNRDLPRQVLSEWNELDQFGSPTKISPRIPSANTYNAVPRATSGNNSGQKTKNHLPINPPSLAIYANVAYLEEDISDWEFPREKLRIQKNVGKGAFCVVAKAFAEGLGTVAVKIPKDNAPETNKKDLLAEYELMKQLEPHPNVIRLMGAVTLSDPVMVMFEYIPYGDLLGFLRRSRGLNDNYYKDPDVKPSSSLTSEQLLKFAREIADGMAFLAANKIIHRDLAARNVLVGEEETCKITDFGMARDVQHDDIYQKRTKGRLPAKWTAMESLLYGYCTTQSDVWSYGIVLYEIFTIGGCPYPNIAAHRIPYMLKNNYRMPKPDHLDDEIYALMCECWSNEPEHRPTFESVSRTIKRLERCRKEVIYMNVFDDQLYGNVEDWD